MIFQTRSRRTGVDNWYIGLYDREGFVSAVFHKRVTENGVNSNISSLTREKSMDLVLTILFMSHIIEQVQIEISSRDQFWFAMHKTVCEPYNLSTHIICEGLYWFRRGFWSLGSHSQLWDCVTNLEIKFKRRRKFSVRCLMAAVGFWVSRSLDPGIKLSGALFLQSFEKKKEFMKLLRSEACHPASG